MSQTFVSNDGNQYDLTEKGLAAGMLANGPTLMSYRGWSSVYTEQVGNLKSQIWFCLQSIMLIDVQISGRYFIIFKVV